VTPHRCSFTYYVFNKINRFCRCGFLYVFSRKGHRDLVFSAVDGGQGFDRSQGICSTRPLWSLGFHSIDSVYIIALTQWQWHLITLIALHLVLHRPGPSRGCGHRDLLPLRHRRPHGCSFTYLQKIIIGVFNRCFTGVFTRLSIVHLLTLRGLLPRTAPPWIVVLES
jgi:hypothetical protein